MTIPDDVRTEYEPLSEVWIGRTPYPDEQECLLIGEINPYPLRQNGEISEQPLQRIPVKKRSAEELIDWIESAPDELDRALEGDLYEVLSRDIIERYPPVPQEVIEG